MWDCPNSHTTGLARRAHGTSIVAMAMRGQAGAGLAVLVIDGDPPGDEALVAGLRALGCAVTEAPAALAPAEARRRGFDLGFLDLGEGQATGERLRVLASLLEASPSLELVVVTGYATIRTAVETIQRGARDFLPRPFTSAQLRHLVERTASRRSLERQVVDLRSQLAQSAPEADLETRSPRMRALLEVLGHAAAHDVAVLLTGDGGTGKSVLARRLHAQSARRQAPFVVVNCGALSEERLGSVLFGQARDGAPGSGKGAAHDQAGRVEAAAGGTLFLDEVAEVPPAIQARLVRLLDDGEYERPGERHARHADVRVVAATNRDLPAEVAAGRFRRDLMTRLDTVTISVPSLRERREDILPLAGRFLAFFGRIAPRAPLELTRAAENALLAYAWPGNVRELRNAIERAVMLATSERVGPELLPERVVARTDSAPFVGGDFTLEAVEREHTLRVMARAQSLDEAAGILGIDPQALWRRRKKYEER